MKCVRVKEWCANPFNFTVICYEGMNMVEKKIGEIKVKENEYNYRQK